MEITRLDVHAYLAWLEPGKRGFSREPSLCHTPEDIDGIDKYSVDNLDDGRVVAVVAKGEDGTPLGFTTFRSTGYRHLSAYGEDLGNAHDFMERFAQEFEDFPSLNPEDEDDEYKEIGEAQDAVAVALEDLRNVLAEAHYTQEKEAQAGQLRQTLFQTCQGSIELQPMSAMKWAKT